MFLKSKKSALIALFLLSLSGLSFVFWLLYKSQHDQINQTQQLLIQEANAHYQNIKELEIWHNKFGGVFEKNTSNESYHFNIYSLNPKNKENIATGFIKESLQYFEKNPEKTTSYEFINNNQDFLFVGVLHTKSKCITCHSNFKIGDVRGGIEISIPKQKYIENITNINKDFYIFRMLVLGFFTLTLGILIYFIHKMYENKKQIEHINKSLENKVQERTKEVQILYNREHYLKKLLETVSEVNESLITSYSLGSIIETSLEKLSHHASYKLILFGHFDGTLLHVRYTFGDLYNLISKELYTLGELQANPLFTSVTQSIINQETYINLNCSFTKPNQQRNREEDYNLHASISFILDEYEEDGVFDIIALYTDRENGFDQEEVAILEGSANDIAMALSAFKQRKLTEKLQNEQISNYEETILAFVDMIEQRDAYTAGHTIRVAKYSRLIAQYLGFDDALIQKIEKAAILHDIGKIATPDTILLKPGKLNALEYKLIQNHVTAGYKMLSKVKMYAELAEIIKFHHEHYDGTGYPYGFKGDEIPMEAHVLIVADAFDAMTSNRIYKSRKTIETALEELAKYSGTQFHPKVIEATLVTLKNVNITQTTQLPQNELEKQRFSYFFNDGLTGLYNEAYLNLILHQTDGYIYYNIVKLRNFSNFNKQYSWSKGNELLILIANELKEHFVGSKIFRFEGDDFMILSQEKTKFKKEMIQLMLIDPDEIISIEHFHGDLKADSSLNALYKLLGTTN